MITMLHKDRTGSSATCPVCVKDIYISEGHNFIGHHGKPQGAHPIKSVDRVECVKGRGLRGDRFFDHKEAYKGQVTFFSFDVFRELCTHVNAPEANPGDLRRNILVEGVDLNELVGRTFEIQGVTFEGTEECKPCYWMDTAVAPGSENFLKGRGGLRARILSDGWLHTDP